jgi:hypothetical protein
MDGAWAGAVIALGGIVVGALLDSLKTRLAFRRDKAWTLYEEQRARIEQVYEVLEQIRDVYAVAFHRADYALEDTSLRLGAADREKPPLAKLRMLLHLYAPGFEHHIPHLETAASRLGFAITASWSNREQTAQRDSLRQQLWTQYSELNDRLDMLRDDIVADIRSLTATKTRGLEEPTSPKRWRIRP